MPGTYIKTEVLNMNVKLKIDAYVVCISLMVCILKYIISSLYIADLIFFRKKLLNESHTFDDMILTITITNFIG